MGSGHGKGEQAHSLQNKALQATTASGLSARHRPQNTTASSWPASQRNNSCRQRWPASRRAVQVDGGSAVVLALRRRAQTYLIVSPHLSPLPVTVPTHSLNLYKPNLAPNLLLLLFFFFFTLYLPTIISSPNPLLRHCSANLCVTYC